MHAYSRRSRRERVEPATAQDFLRFLLRWQHLAPGTQLVGDAGLATVIGRLQGWEAAAAAWEPELFARRLRTYDPSALDRLCHDGEVGWLRAEPASARRRRTRRRAQQGDADLGAVPRRRALDAGRGTRRAPIPSSPMTGATAEIVEVLRERGACFATELGEATRRLPDDIERRSGTA